MATDITARDEGSLWIVSGETTLGHDWLEENLQDDAMRWAGACADGLEVLA